MRVLAGLGACLVASIAHASENTSKTKAQQEESTSEILRRGADIEARLANEPIIGIRKMSTDPGEKFFPEYWHFGDSLDVPGQNDGLAGTDLAHFNTTARRENLLDTARSSFSPAQFLSRSFAYSPSVESAFGLKRSRILDSRDFKCPANTYSCTSIDRPDRCCSVGSACEIVPDTGAGDVGCCPSGQSCSGTIGAFISVVTVTVGASVTVSTVTHSTSQQTSETTSSTSISTSSSTSSSTTTVRTSTSSTAASTTTTESLIPPARGTSITSMTSSATSRVSVCPTGFYACSAVYHGGCCQTDRNCDTFSCPAIPSTTVTSDGRTIIIPVATPTATVPDAPSASEPSDSTGGTSIRSIRVANYLIGPFESEEGLKEYLIRPSWSGGFPSESAYKNALARAKGMGKMSYPIVFTHGDIKPHNVLVTEGQITGFLDWESAGWYPDYWDFTTALRIGMEDFWWYNFVIGLGGGAYLAELDCERALTSLTVDSYCW
ncbi:hypothetical protein POX_d05729 [Penicillium oxalicum]|uniref:hypothetical protein n=1 Tax=Penicillium oxalicum TaxID=69781 RepID=UPI0020B74223|nr:hypothetical protein POX_d05729 [Penicillium oxalicum]KAI2790223.1 hypothetical protein POX_d05729 [Penicillium oxalicum]